MTINSPETPRGTGSKKEEDSPNSDTTGLTVASSTADGADLELKQSASEVREEPGILGKVGDVEDNVPKEIKDKTYQSSEEFCKDLEKYGLQDCKHIALDSDGKACWKMVASQFHKAAVNAIEKAVEKAEVVVYTDKEPTFQVEGSHGGLVVEKEPDLAIWGTGRIADGEPAVVSISNGPKRLRATMDPNVIIEFSWTNKLPKEISKFNEQMNKHMHAGSLGKVEVGFLIKTIPLLDNSYPGRHDSEQEIIEKPICGFDVFKARAGETVGDDSDRHLTYRVGNEDSSVIEISGKDLGEGSRSEDVLVSIPLSAVREALKKRGVSFQQEDNQQYGNALA